jgi:hypothetical protein
LGTKSDISQNDKREGGCSIKVIEIAIWTNVTGRTLEGIMKLSRQGRPWKGEVPRKSGPVDPVENQRDVSQGRKGRRQGCRDRRRFFVFFFLILRRMWLRLRRRIGGVMRIGGW